MPSNQRALQASNSNNLVVLYAMIMRINAWGRTNLAEFAARVDQQQDRYQYIFDNVWDRAAKHNNPNNQYSSHKQR